MSELTALTIAEARDKLKAKAITATELTDAYLSAIDSANDTINAYVKVTHDQARSMAKASMSASPRARRAHWKAFRWA